MLTMADVREVAQRAAERQLSKNKDDKLTYLNLPVIDLSRFKSEFWPGYEHAAHQVAIDEKLKQVAAYIRSDGREGIGRLMIFMPPRHGKTLTASRLFPAWLVGQMPDLRIIMASYGAKLATRNSRFIRNAIGTERYQGFYPGVRLSDDTAAANEWDIAEHGGGMMAVGVGSGITGHGAKLIIVDDPVKSRAEAESETYRQRCKDWYTDDLLTRLEEPGGAIVIMQTRWHQDDLSGWLLREDDEQEWDVLCLPAIADKDDQIGREVGAALWPARYPLDKLTKRQRDIGDYSFAALYQQSPVPSQGGLFKREKFNIIDVPPADIVRTVRFWDLAMSERTSADYTCGGLMGITVKGRLVILDVVREQLDWDFVEPKIAGQTLLDERKVQVGVETAFYQTRAVKKLLARPELHGFSIQGIRPDTDKFTRALPFAARVGEGMVDVLRRSWTEPLVEELCSFPYGVNDDQVDMCSGAYLMLEAMKPIKATTGRYA